MSLPLQGMRILAIEQYGAGPFSTQHLADLGAEVIKIENPHDEGDVGRAVGPYYFGPGDSHLIEIKKALGLILNRMLAAMFYINCLSMPTQYSITCAAICLPSWVLRMTPLSIFAKILCACICRPMAVTVSARIGPATII